MNKAWAVKVRLITSLTIFCIFFNCKLYQAAENPQTSTQNEKKQHSESTESFKFYAIEVRDASKEFMKKSHADSHLYQLASSLVTEDTSNLAQKMAHPSYFELVQSENSEQEQAEDPPLKNKVGQFLNKKNVTYMGAGVLTLGALAIVDSCFKVKKGVTDRYIGRKIDGKKIGAIAVVAGVAAIIANEVFRLAPNPVEVQYLKKMESIGKKLIEHHQASFSLSSGFCELPYLKPQSQAFKKNQYFQPRFGKTHAETIFVRKLKDFDLNFSNLQYSKPYKMGDGQFSVQGKIGEGTFGVVYDVRYFSSRSQVQIALKKIKKVPNSGNVYNEIYMLDLLNQTQRSVKYYGSFKDPDGNLYIAMEKMDGSLKDAHTPYKKQFFRDVVDGLGELKARKVVHFDIKPDNFLIKKGRLYFSDFDGARQVNYKVPYPQTTFTPLYKAPERYDGKIFSPYRSDPYAADIYSSGLSLYNKKYPNLFVQAEREIHAIRRNADPALFDQSALMLKEGKISYGEFLRRTKLGDEYSQGNLARILQGKISHSGHFEDGLIRKMIEPDPRLRIKLEDLKTKLQ